MGALRKRFERVQNSSLPCTYWSSKPWVQANTLVELSDSPHIIYSVSPPHTFIDCSARSTVPCFNLIQPILPPRASSRPRLNSNTNFNTGTLCSKGKTLRFRALLTHAYGTQMCCLVNTVRGINSEVVGTLTLTSSISRHISTNPSPSTHNTFWGNFKPYLLICQNYSDRTSPPVLLKFVKT